MPPSHCSCWRKGPVMTIWAILSNKRILKGPWLITLCGINLLKQSQPMTSVPYVLQLYKVVHRLTFTWKHKYTLHCLLCSEKECTCYSHMRKSMVKEIMLNPLQSYSRPNWSRSGCLFCQFFVEVSSHAWPPHTCFNILKYSVLSHFDKEKVISVLKIICKSFIPCFRNWIHLSFFHNSHYN